MRKERSNAILILDYVDLVEKYQEAIMSEHDNRWAFSQDNLGFFDSAGEVLVASSASVPFFSGGAVYQRWIQGTSRLSRSHNAIVAGCNGCRLALDQSLNWSPRLPHLWQ